MNCTFSTDSNIQNRKQKQLIAACNIFNEHGKINFRVTEAYEQFIQFQFAKILSIKYECF